MPRRAGPAVQCSACKNNFYDIVSFDAHRSGHVNNRKCANPGEIGMHLTGTVWRMPATMDA